MEQSSALVKDILITSSRYKNLVEVSRLILQCISYGKMCLPTKLIAISTIHLFEKVANNIMPLAYTCVVMIPNELGTFLRRPLLANVLINPFLKLSLALAL